MRGQQGSGETQASYLLQGQEPDPSKEGDRWPLSPNIQCPGTWWSLSSWRIRSLAPKGVKAMRPTSHLNRGLFGAQQGELPQGRAGPLGATPGHLPPPARARAPRSGPSPGWAAVRLQPTRESSRVPSVCNGVKVNVVVLYKVRKHYKCSCLSFSSYPTLFRFSRPSFSLETLS